MHGKSIPLNDRLACTTDALASLWVGRRRRKRVDCEQRDASQMLDGSLRLILENLVLHLECERGFLEIVKFNNIEECGVLRFSTDY